MKKIFLSLIALFLLVGCSNGTAYKEITYNEFASQVKSKETFVIFIGSATCSHCDDFKPILSQVIEDYDLDVKYIDLSKVSEAQYSEVKKKVDLSGTPTLSYIEEGNCDTSKNLVGSNTYDDTVEYFKSIGTSGISKNGKAMQVIVGLKVPKVRDKFENVLNQSK